MNKTLCIKEFNIGSTGMNQINFTRGVVKIIDLLRKLGLNVKIVILFLNKLITVKFYCGFHFSFLLL